MACAPIMSDVNDDQVDPIVRKNNEKGEAAMFRKFTEQGGEGVLKRDDTSRSPLRMQKLQSSEAERL